MSPYFLQKNPRVRKIRVRNSGAGNGCANFMDTWKNAFFLQEKPMSIRFLLLGGPYRPLFSCLIVGLGLGASNCEGFGVSLRISVSSKRCFRKRRRQQPGCVRNASKMRQKMRQKWVLFYWEKRNVQNAPEMRQNCVQNASKMRGTPSGENTFWTIPRI